jgi:hypothetical protein
LDKRALERLAGKEAVPLMALVDDLSKDLGYGRDKVVEGLMGLQSRKAIVLSEKAPYASFWGYALSPISVWFWAAAGATLLSVAFVFATSGVALDLRYVFGSILVLFLPGFSLIELLYPKRELDELTRFALSIGLSLALVPLVGLVLNYTPFGIRLLPVVFSLSGLTLVFLVAALTRKHTYYKVAKDLA